MYLSLLHIYVFFTYSFLMVAWHPFFALPMVYRPLLLLGVEQVLAKRRPYLLIVTCLLYTSRCV